MFLLVPLLLGAKGINFLTEKETKLLSIPELKRNKLFRFKKI